MPLLTIAIAVPLAAAAVCTLLPSRESNLPRAIAAVATAIPFAALLATWIRFDSDRGMQLIEEAEWIPSIDVAWRLGVDGMSLALALLTVVLFAASIAWGLGPKPMSKQAAGLLMLLQSACLAFFLAQDFFLFYVAFEINLVAMYFLIALWGEENRRYAALKFFIYTLVGSLPVLLGIIGLFLASEPNTFDMRVIAAEQPLAGAGVGASLAFAAFFIGFAIKIPVAPVHTWLPAAHVEAPTAGSVILAGVLLKLGTYGLVRVNLQMLPDAFAEYALAVALIGLVSVIFGALVAMAQTDLKRLIAYTSINHMGYVVVGVAAAAAATSTDAARLALDGAVLQMIAHGLVTGLLFFLAGFVAHRAGTRDLRELAGLMRPMPLYGSIVALAFFASLGLPGLAQFPAELQIFLGTFEVWPAIGALVVVGIAITAALFLRALNAAWLGETPERWSGLQDLGRREAAVGIGLAALIVAVGIYPTLLLDLIGQTPVTVIAP